MVSFAPALLLRPLSLGLNRPAISAVGGGVPRPSPSTFLFTRLVAATATLGSLFRPFPAIPSSSGGPGGSGEPPRPWWLYGLLLALAGCTFDTSGLALPDGGRADAGSDANPDAPPDSGRDSGRDAQRPDANQPDAGVDAGPDASPDAGPDSGLAFIPSPFLPTAGAVLPPNWGAYLAWGIPTTPAGRSITGFRICYTTDGVETIDDPGECPLVVAPITDPLYLLDPLTEMTDYQWKVEACYNADLTDCSGYSPVQLFSTGANLMLTDWRMDDAAGPTTADSSGRGHDGTLENGTTWAPGLISSSLLFDQAMHSYIHIPGDADFVFDATADFTIDLWMNPVGLAGDDYAVLLANQTLGNFQLLLTPGGAAAAGINFEAGGALPDIPLQANISSDTLTWDDSGETWYNITLIREVGLLTIYRDDVEVGSGDVSIAFGDATDLDIGYRASTGDHPYGGRLDEYSILGAALSPEARRNKRCATLVRAGLSLAPDCIAP